MKKPCHCIAIMQMEGVACLGWKKSPGESARSSRKESPEIVLSRRAGKKWAFLVCQNIMKVIPTERARRNEEVGFGIT